MTTLYSCAPWSKGGTNKSYGIQVARLAGVPDQIIDLAKTVLSSVETTKSHGPATTVELAAETPRQKAQSRQGQKINGNDGQMEPVQHQSAPHDLRQMLADQVDIALMTPLDALNFLNQMKQKVKS